ncbi:hypothetical protein EC036_34050 [Enterobacter cloacae]|nr:hypothetical protein EC036_34050 [Enterobacter cloacae]
MSLIKNKYSFIVYARAQCARVRYYRCYQVTMCCWLTNSS